MPRKRTGTLIERPSGFFARVPVARGQRETMDLGTKDAATARLRLNALVGELEKKAAV